MSEYVNFKGGVVSKSNFLPMRKEKFGFGPTGTSRLEVLEGCQECRNSFDCANSGNRPEGNVISTCSGGCCVYTRPTDGSIVAPTKDRAARFAGRGGQSRVLDGGRCSVSCPSGGICTFPCDRPVSQDKCCRSHAERGMGSGQNRNVCRVCCGYGPRKGKCCTGMCGTITEGICCAGPGIYRETQERNFSGTNWQWRASNSYRSRCSEVFYVYTRS